MDSSEDNLDFGSERLHGNVKTLFVLAFYIYSYI